MNLERVKWINYMENTRLLYMGIEHLYTMWQDYFDPAGKSVFDPQNLWDSEHLLSMVTEAESDAIVETDTKHQAVKWRDQNRLTDFFKFLQAELLASRKLVKEHDVRELTAKLLCLFSVSKDIAKYSGEARIPYLYERLCNSMRGLAESDMCYLLYCRDGNLMTLSMSSPMKAMLDYELDEPDFLELHRKRERLEQSAQFPQELGQTVFKTELWKQQRNAETSCHFQIVLLVLELENGARTSQRELAYLVFQTMDTSQPEKEEWEQRENISTCLEPMDLFHIRNILFLQSMIVEPLQKNLHILMTSQRTCQYVEPLSGTEDLHILHLTDLHIKSGLDSGSFESIIACLPQTAPDGSPFDLLVLTGDVVQGQCVAGELEEHYQLADKLLRGLAQRLWSYKSGQVRGDWRKRMVIIPGNHDYATMNELEVIPQKGSRSTGIGRPAQKEGGPMVKFAYYIQFIQRLLGLDIDSLIRNRLNSVWYYDQMNLGLLCLNTVSEAGPLRNNKVHIDAGFVERVKKAGRFSGKDVVCLAHHTAAYTADYAADRYYTPKIKPYEDIGKYMARFRAILKMPVAEKHEQLAVKKEIEQLYQDLYGLGLAPEEDILMADVMFYRNNFRELGNERCEAIRSAMTRDVNMQAADQKNQDEMICELISATGIQIILGGHIHKTNLMPAVHCYEGPLFYQEANKENAQDAGALYGILTLHRKENVHDWVGYVSTEKGTVQKPGEAARGIPTDVIDFKEIEKLHG